MIMSWLSSYRVLNDKSDELLTSAPEAPSENVQTVFLPLDSFAAAGDLVERNWDQRSISEGVVQAVRIAARNGPTPAAPRICLARSPEKRQ
jgi:hypothetical protein